MQQKPQTPGDQDQPCQAKPPVVPVSAGTSALGTYPYPRKFYLPSLARAQIPTGPGDPLKPLLDPRGRGECTGGQR